MVIGQIFQKHHFDLLKLKLWTLNPQNTPFEKKKKSTCYTQYHLGFNQNHHFISKYESTIKKHQFDLKVKFPTLIIKACF